MSLRDSSAALVPASRSVQPSINDNSAGVLIALCILTSIVLLLHIIEQSGANKPQTIHSLSETLSGHSSSSHIEVHSHYGSDSGGQQEFSTGPHAEDFERPALIHAIIAGDEDLVITLVEHDADLDAEDHDGPALIHAIREGYEGLAITLVEQGADLDAEDYDGPALTQAIRARYKGLVAKLIGSGDSIMESESYALTISIT
jgi:hypothetical protein